MILSLVHVAAASITTRPAFPNKTYRNLKLAALAAMFSISVPDMSCAQSADENAVAGAEDAFGFRVGSETVGLYTSSSVRGFSPISANNIRIEGLYFDQQGYLVYNAFDSSSIEVGLNARDYVLPNPSGVVDFRLRRPGGRDLVSVTAGVDPLRSPYLSLTGSSGGEDGEAGLAGRIAFYPGGNNVKGAENRNLTVGLVGVVPLATDLDFSIFAELEDYKEQSSPTFFTSGPHLPPEVPRGKFLGQPWSRFQYRSMNGGMIVNWKVGVGSNLRLGLFRSSYYVPRETHDLIMGINQHAGGRRFIYVFPSRMDKSVSGELQYQRVVETGEFRVTGTGSIRGRTVDRRRGGAAILDLGATNLTGLETIREPDFNFGPRAVDAVDQIGLGLHGRVEWNRRVDASLGIQRSHYRKAVAQGSATESFASTPWLYQALAAWSIASNFVAYVSASNGLEESGIAPAQASNRGEVLPATITKQREVGFRTTSGPMTLTVSGFYLTKPYPNLDALNRFRFLGMIRHRGVEVSLAGQPVTGLTVVAGALYLDAEVEQDYDGSTLRSPAVGQAGYSVLLSANYQLPQWTAISVDGSVTFQGDRTAKINPTVKAEDYAVFNAGIRYQISPHFVARVELRNLFDVYAYNVSSTSAFGYNPGRSLRVAVTWSP